MTPMQRIATRIAFLLIVISGGLLGIVLKTTPAQASCSTCTGYFYGASSLIITATNGTIWPQNTSNACGIADSIALLNYEDLQHSRARMFPNGAGQATVEKNNQTAGASQWGNATPINAWGGITNIAPDFGTDPRSVAYDVKQYAWSTLYIHDSIYRWQFAHTTAPAFATQAKEATTLLARALKIAVAPAIAFINGGVHSVIVTGVWSSNNPNTYFPAGIRGLVYRDPEGNSTTSRQEIQYNAWIGGNYASPWGVYSLWSRYYGDRSAVGDMLNTYDPEPTVGPYTPTATDPHHWYLGFTWVARDLDATDKVDWAINAYTNKVIKPTIPTPTPTVAPTPQRLPLRPSDDGHDTRAKRCRADERNEAEFGQRAREAARLTTQNFAYDRYLVGNLAYVLLAGAVVFFAVVVIVATRHPPADQASAAISNAAATRVAATADTGSGWIQLSSDTPGAVIAAARKTTLFTMDRSGNGDYLKDLSHLETPVLVLALHPAGSIVMPDYYIIPIDDKSSVIVGAAELALNPTHTAIQLTSIITYSSPRPHGQMAKRGDVGGAGGCRWTAACGHEERRQAAARLRPN